MFAWYLHFTLKVTIIPHGNTQIPQRDVQNMQTLHRKPFIWEIEPETSCCEGTALTTKPPCCSLLNVSKLNSTKSSWGKLNHDQKISKFKLLVVFADWRGTDVTTERANRKNQEFIWKARARAGDVRQWERPTGIRKLGLLWFSQGGRQMIEPRPERLYDADVSGHIVPVLSLTFGFYRDHLYSERAGLLLLSWLGNFSERT